jgi:Flp pilus assembly protein TadD
VWPVLVFLGLCSCVPAEQRLVRSLAEHGLWREVEARLQAELVRQPDSAQLHNNLGVCYEALGDSEQAIRQYERALALAPDDPRIRSNLEAARRLASGRQGPRKAATP